jgi:hypothetical protein
MSGMKKPEKQEGYIMRHFRELNKTIAVLLMTAAVFWAGAGLNSCFAQDNLQKDKNEIVKQACLKATITAIKMEIERWQRWNGQRTNNPDAEGLPMLEEELVKLQADLEKYQKMKVHDYGLPLQTATKAWVGETAKDGSILYVDRMSKSGPWHHLAGIVGDDYSVLQPDVRRKVTFYPVYKRSYWNMTSEYICVTEVQ